MAKEKLRTSREIYDQLRWDPRLDASAVLIGVEERTRGVVEITFAEFQPDGDIPWHRLLYFRGPEGMLWDRRERLDRLRDVGTRAPAQVVASSLLTALDSFTFDPAAEAWLPSLVDVGTATPGPRTFTLLTWNVLFDIFDGAQVVPEARRQRLLETLRAEQPDVIALQEVTPPLVHALLAEPWVRAQYRVTEGPGATGVTPYGVMVLSRIALARVAEHRFTRDKRVLAVELVTRGPPLALAVVHLTSDYAQNSAVIREREMHGLVDTVMGSPEWAEHDWVVAGDVNDHRFEHTHPELLARSGLRDVWHDTARLHECGFTYDPIRNPVAREVSSSGRRRRFDRVLLRSRAGRWGAQASRLVGTEHPCSDHDGLAVTLGEDVRRARPVHQSALVTLLPEDLRGQVDALRAQHDRHAERWMPHLTLLYGFVPAHRFAEAAPRLERALAGLAPFRARFSELRSFEHRGSVTLYAAPDNPEPWRRLQAALESEFPECTEQSGHGTEGFTPHLTLGQCALAQARTLLSSWQRGWTPFDLEVNAVAMIAREGETPFTVRGEIALGGASLTLPPLPRAALPVDLTSLQRAVEAAAGTKVELHRVGSTAFGVQQEDSDTDVVAVLTKETDADAFFACVTAELGAQSSRAVRGARHTRLELTLEGAAVDLQLGFADSPGTMRPVEELKTLLTWVGERTDPHLYRLVLAHVRRWARARAVDSQALGYPGGFTWALLTAAALSDAPADALYRPEALLTHVLSRYASWPWPQPVELAEAGHPFQVRDVLPVRHPLTPFENTAHSATWSTRAVLTEELQRALVLRGDWPRFFEPFLPGESWPGRLVLRAAEQGNAEALGLARARFPRYVLLLERDPLVRLRPFRRRSDGVPMLLYRGGLSASALSLVPELTQST